MTYLSAEGPCTCGGSIEQPERSSALSDTGISYQLAPRAKISRRDQGQVANLEQLKAYMRSNSWSTDPLSGGTSFGAICGRGDIDPKNPKASGCNDAKVRVQV
eukprot:GHUV01045164.1.p1 GENE.GHUV01045164.1~~GHUV01045164.1.p1  ORF type:complete len:103 (-),score=26.27 GHUV01045164.1:186-494(-)